MHPIFINGAWVDARTESSREVLNPATLEVLERVPECGAGDTERAVGAARAALPEWGRLSPEERAALLGEVGAGLRAHGRELAALLTRETGKPLCESSDCIIAVTRIFDRCAAALRARREELGVIAVIAPFNFPLLTWAACVAPAIAAGNTVVCKPPPQNPLSTLRLAQLCA